MLFIIFFPFFHNRYEFHHGQRRNQEVGTVNLREENWYVVASTCIYSTNFLGDEAPVMCPQKLNAKTQMMLCSMASHLSVCEVLDNNNILKPKALNQK